MARPKVYVTRILPSEKAMNMLREYCDVDLNEKPEPPSREELIEHVKGKDGLLCLLTDKIDKEVMDVAPNLKVISTYSVGFDHIDIEEATKRGIYVTHTPGVLTEAVADLTWGLILAVARRVVESDKLIRQGSWKGAWSPTFMLGREVYGKTLGIIGMGRIGTAVARRAKGFNMRIIYFDKARRENVEKELGAEYKPMEEVLKEADIISLHVPLTKETHHLIGERELKMMKKTAILINTARGAVVDTDALVRALKEGWIAGAGLDVFEQEPLPEGHPLTKLDNVVLTPHIGSAAVETRARMAEMAVENLIAVLKGEEPKALANPDVKNVRPLSEVKMI
ncbi:MAG: D-glycerate dehydrogenase [Thermoprotei archaeon]|nr:D-glycerate dehydrogenase [Thermoprotei archaeon]